jgi:hypothetical protein
MNKTLRKTRKVITFVLLFTTILAIILVGLLNKELYKEMVSIIKDDIYPAIIILLTLFGFVVGGVVKNPPKSFDKFLENGFLQIAVLEMFLFVIGLIVYSYYKSGTGTIEIVLKPEIPGPQKKVLMTKPGGTVDTILVPDTLPGKEPGNYTFKLIEMGYHPYQKQIYLQAFGEETVVLDVIKNSGTLVLATEPSGAEIWINGFRIGLTSKGPDTLRDLERKKTELKLKLKGYDPYENQEIDLISDNFQNLGIIPLTPIHKKPLGKLKIRTNEPGMKVFINGVYQNVLTPCILELKPGDNYRVLLTKRSGNRYGYQMEKSVSIINSRTTEIDTQLSAFTLNELIINPQKANCTYFLNDDQVMDIAEQLNPIRIYVFPGDNVIRKRMATGETFTYSINVRDRFGTEINF